MSGRREIRLGHLSEPSGEAPAEELTELLLRRADCRLERIVSTGQASPPGFWYDQAEDEWVLLLSGQATLRFADPDRLVELRTGDHLLIPAHRRHRVEFTASRPATEWLVLFLPAETP